MMSVNPIQIVQALVGAELTIEKTERYLPQGNVVTISRDYGSAGTEIAQKLAERLNVSYYDKQILDAIIEAAHENRAIMERLDELVSSTRDEVMQVIITGKSPTDEYRRHLINVILSIARKSGVIVGRGGHIILGRHHVFRVRVVASPDTCAMRIAKRENIVLAQAAHWVKRANDARAEFCKKVFNRSINDPTTFDLVINTGHIDAEAATGLILFTMGKLGYALPHAAHQQIGKLA
jgi:CMP/dCMP kinase